ARAALFRRPSDRTPVELLNPLAQDASWVRTPPLEGVLTAVATNVRRQQPDVRIFELCKTYEHSTEHSTGKSEHSAGKSDVSEPASTPLRPPPNQAGLKDTATTEKRWLAIALSGARAEPGWSGSRDPGGGHQAKGCARARAPG